MARWDYRRNRQTGTMIIIEPSDNDPRWWTCICEQHDQCCDFYSKSEAIRFAASPVDWCTDCYPLYEAKRGGGAL